MAVTVRHITPSWYIRGAENVQRLEIYHDGVQTTPSGGTYSLLTDAGVAVVDAQDITISGQTATYTVPASALPSTLDLSWLWLERWSITAGDATYTISRHAALVRGSVYPGLVLADLERYQPMVSRIARSAADPTFSDVIEEAWQYLLRRLAEDARRPPRILNGTVLVDWHRWVTLWMVFQGAGREYAELEAKYWGLAAEARRSVPLTLDEDDDGRPGAEEQGQTSGRAGIAYSSRRWGG